MTTLWTYPWSLYAEGVDEALADLATRGVDAVAPAAHYHSVESMQPRTPDRLFDRRAGGCYFDPDPERFAETPVDPVPNAVEGVDDPLAGVVDAAADHGLAVHGWTVLFHNSRLGAANPEYQTRDAFGNAHEHSFCPSHEAVRAYFEAVVGSLADYGLSEIELESVGYPSAFHPHDTTFGHHKRQVLTTPTEEWLFSQCFCEACRSRAAERDVNVDRARSIVRRLLRESFEDPHSDPPALAALLREYPTLDDLFDVRAEVVGDLLERLAAAAGDADLDCYLMDGFGVDPGDGWPAGVRLDDVERHCDRATALCYVSDPDVARDRVRTLERSVDVPVDAGVTLDPDVVQREAEFRALFEAVRAEATGDVNVYHHSLATEAQLDWVARATEAGR
ncbi:MAG: hypothetical protein ABEJ04_03770 [Halobacteriaceae archaeon]